MPTDGDLGFYGNAPVVKARPPNARRAAKKKSKQQKLSRRINRR